MCIRDRGTKHYAESCAWCHGGGAVSGGMAPDLRESPIVMSREAFKAVVVDGAKAMNGMPQFKALDDTDIDELMHYIRKMAREAVGQTVSQTNHYSGKETRRKLGLQHYGNG